MFIYRYVILKESKNRFQGIDYASLCSLAGRYNNPIPTWFLAPIDCSKIPALKMQQLYVHQTAGVKRV